MDLKDSLKLERYKLVTERQKYFTDLAREAAGTYLKFLSALVAAAITVVSTSNKLDLDRRTVTFVITSIASLITFLAFATAGQVAFCLWRWQGFRRAEAKINPDCPSPDKAWWIFETIYIVVIGVSVAMAWLMAFKLPNVVR